MHISSSGYFNLIFVIVIIGAMVEVIWQLSEQMKNIGKWVVDYDNLAVNIIVSMLIMCVFTRLLWDSLETYAFVIIWLLLPCYILLRNLKKH